MGRVHKVVGAAVMLGALALINVAIAGVASAFANPHEGAFSSTTGSCAACHRTHTASAARLLAAAPDALCMACHDGSGADTDVASGIYIGSTNGTTGAGLRGGGFDQALLNTDLSPDFDEAGTAAAATSRHTVQAPLAIAWGAGALGSNHAGNSISLDCTDCHNPHGNGQYRMLRPRPVNGSGISSVLLADEDPRQYTVAYDADQFRDTAYVPANTSAWCAQCHTRYQSASTDSSGDDIFDRRHRTDIAGECLSCHTAHGTSAAMTESSSGIKWPGGALADWQDADEGDSRLLQLDNRYVCTRCHQAAADPAQHAAPDECASCHRSHTADEDHLLIAGVCTACHGQPPETGSHDSHLAAAFGPALTGCDSCHSYAPGTHNDGQADFADGLGLASTAVCDACHSPGGALDGVADAVLGAKANWASGVYNAGSLKAGLGDWCLTCHDDVPSTVNAVSAPNVLGDGVTYGYKLTGHGRTGTVACDQCHDPATDHVDGLPRTYDAAADNYQAGYRLRYAMDIPLGGDTYEQTQFALCFQCHTYSGFLNQDPPYITNFRKEDKDNYHREHIVKRTDTVWDSDWSDGGFDDGTSVDSRMSCTTCHNVHGSPQAAMIRDGSLVGRSPLITFKWFTDTNLGGAETLALSQSRSASCASFGCHGDEEYDRLPDPSTNRAPVAADDAYATDEDTPLTVAAPGALANDSDVDGDTLTAVLDSGVSGGTLTLNADGSFSYTPNTGFFGTDSFTYHASDGTADSGVATVTIDVG